MNSSGLITEMEAGDGVAVAQVQAGDREAFRVLVERHSQSIFRLGFRMTGKEEDAEEVVQEAFLRAYRSIGRFQARANFGTWLYRIAVNCALDLLEKRTHRQEQSITHEEEDDMPQMQIASPDPGPERQLLSSELQRRVAAALDNLTPVERVAFTMRHFENRSIEEIQRTLKVRSGAAKNAVFRAVRKMRRALEPAMRSSL
jgi:RNA polymerase sigma-70 factor (ECF subfamily)